MTEYSVILVWSSSHAIRTEHILNQAGIECKLIPTPRQFTSDCGLSVRIKRTDTEAVREALDNAWAEYKGIRELL
jgi:hypothetical protein